MTGLGPEARALLEAAHGGDEPTQKDRERVRAALATRLAASAVVGLGVAAAAKVSASVAKAGGLAAAGSSAGLATKAIVAAALVGAFSAGVLTIAHKVSLDTAASVRVAGQPAAVSLEAPGPLKDRTIEIVSQAAPATPAVEREAEGIRSIGRSSRPAAPSLRNVPAGAEVAAEVRLLGEAQAAIRSGDAPGALALLDGYEHRFPKGALGEERDAARIAALCALGRVAEAREATERFLRAAPLSPLGGPIRASCGASLAGPAPSR